MAVVNGKQVQCLGMEWVGPYIDPVSKKESDEKSEALIPQVSFRRQVKSFSFMLQRVGDDGQLTTNGCHRQTIEDTFSCFGSSSSLAHDNQRALLDKVDGLSAKIGSMQLEPLPMPVNGEKKTWFEEISGLANQPNTQENMDLITAACVLKVGANVTEAASQVWNATDTVMDWAKNKVCNVHPMTKKVCDGVTDGNTKIIRPILDGVTDVMDAVSGLPMLERLRGDMKPSNSKVDSGVSSGLEEYMVKDLERMRNVFIENKVPDPFIKAGDMVLDRAHERGLIGNE